MKERDIFFWEFYKITQELAETKRSLEERTKDVADLSEYLKEHNLLDSFLEWM